MNNLCDLCDLHVHSIKSDGSDTPKELIKMALEYGLKAIALTDHDTIDGLSEAYHKSLELGIDFLSGIEFSVISNSGNMHILGYLFDEKNEKFNETISLVQDAREKRNHKIASKLAKLGMPIDMDDLEKISNGGEIGRPHFARLMVLYGYVRSIQDAFDLYLKKGAPAYEPKAILSPEDAIKIIHEAKGVAVLAHPISLNIPNFNDLKSAILDLKDKGLDGVECYYPEHDPQFTRDLIDICEKNDLIITGGSDYHGKAKPGIKMGKGRGNLQIPYECVTNLKKRHEKIRIN